MTLDKFDKYKEYWIGKMYEGKHTYYIRMSGINSDGSVVCNGYYFCIGNKVTKEGGWTMLYNINVKSLKYCSTKEFERIENEFLVNIILKM